MHVYLCEACWHDRHDWCRRRCLFCAEPCLCLICHSRSKESAMTTPEPIDNPASTEDAEYGEPVVDAEEPGQVPAADLGVEGEAEPLPDGDADEDPDADEDDEEVSDDEVEEIDEAETDDADA